MTASTFPTVFPDSAPGGAHGNHPEIEWQDFHESGRRVYKCTIYIWKEVGDDGYSVIAVYLPGVCSQGATEAEAIVNVTEAFQGAFAVYAEQGREIPWQENPSERPEHAKEKWILVDA